MFKTSLTGLCLLASWNFHVIMFARCKDRLSPENGLILADTKTFSPGMLFPRLYLISSDHIIFKTSPSPNHCVLFSSWVCILAEIVVFVFCLSNCSSTVSLECKFHDGRHLGNFGHP